ncbi:MAG: hypothetical protein QOG54_2237 [Actinomycetota bacterium]|jgi:hypothetical protein|nr:hypothetical protein [Actinomycetota bacterium]
MKREGGGGAEQVTLKIPRPLYDQLKQVIGGSGFHSVTEFAVYVLRDLVSHHRRGEGAPGIPPAARPAEASEAPGTEPLSPEEIEAIRKRLESLGYL